MVILINRGCFYPIPPSNRIEIGQPVIGQVEAIEIVGFMLPNLIRNKEVKMIYPLPPKKG